MYNFDVGTKPASSLNQCKYLGGMEHVCMCAHSKIHSKFRKWEKLSFLFVPSYFKYFTVNMS